MVVAWGKIISRGGWSLVPVGEVLRQPRPLRLPVRDGNGGGNRDVWIIWVGLAGGLYRIATCGRCLPVVLLLVLILPTSRDVIVETVVPILGFESQLSVSAAADCRAIVLKRGSDVVHGLEVMHGEGWWSGCGVSVVLVVCKTACHLERVTDLSAVPTPVGTTALTALVEEIGRKVE
jgi:hypothetical protein